jgi:CTP:molybdopterin cytidylyltransferase MocA
VRAHPELVHEAPQDSSGILADIDTPEDFRRMEESR